MSVPPVTHISYLMILFAVALLGPTVYFILRARRGSKPKIRRIPGVDAIDEAIGRATEMGRPIVFTTGLTGLSPLLYACLGILTHIGRRSARMGTRVIVPQSDYEVMPIVEEVMREAYRDEGKLDRFKSEEIRFLSTTQFAFASGYMGTVHRENAASCFMFGNFAAESLILAEAGQQVGAMQVAGTTDSEQVPYFITSCDYTLIGEEVYAAGAYLSQDPNQLGGLRGQDVAKMGVLATMFLGLAFALGVTLFRGDSNEADRYTSPYTVAFYQKPTSRRCIARIEASTPFKPATCPAWEKLNPETADLSDDIVDECERLARSLRRLGGAAADNAAWLTEKLSSLTSEAARKASVALASEFRQASERANSDRKKLESALEQHRTMAARIDAFAPAAFAATWRARVDSMATWAKIRGQREEQESCAAAAESLANLKGAGDIDALGDARDAVRRAFELVRDRYYELMQQRHDELEELSDRLTFPAAGRPLAFDASRSIDGDGDRLTFTWSYGDAEGDAPASQSPRSSHTYVEPGSYTVTLTVSDKLPSQDLSIAPPPADESIVWRKETAAGTELSFSWPMPANVVSDTPKVAWDFGDGRTGSGPTATHTYGEPGSYVMSVSASYDVTEEAAAYELASSSQKIEAEPTLRALRGRLAKRMEKLESLASAVGEKAAKVRGLLGTATGTLPASVEPAQAEAKRIKGEAEAMGEIASGADRLMARAASVRATVETFGAAVRPAAEVAGAPVEGETVRRAVEKLVRIYWTVEPEHTHSRTESITIIEAQADIPPPWVPLSAKGGGD